MDITGSDLRGTVLIRDCLEAEAGFLLVQLIKTALAVPDAAQQRRVVLLAAAQEASHYAAVLRRAGLQLPALTAAGRLVLVDLLPACGGGALPSLRDVQRMVASAAAADSGGSGGSDICLVVDDLAVSPVSAATGGWLSALRPWRPPPPALQHASDDTCVVNPVRRCCSAWQRAPLAGRPSCRRAWRPGRWGPLRCRHMAAAARRQLCPQLPPRAQGLLRGPCLG